MAPPRPLEQRLADIGFEPPQAPTERGRVLMQDGAREIEFLLAAHHQE